MAIVIVAFPLAAGACHKTDPHTPNPEAAERYLRARQPHQPGDREPDTDTDIACWRKLAIQGNSDGDWIDIISVPLDNPAGAAFLRREPSMQTCHDIGSSLATPEGCMFGRGGLRVFSLGGPAGGSLVDPLLLDHVDVPGVTIGHSAAFSWDGETIIFGHEPGGGVAAACEATDPPGDRSFFFYDTGKPHSPW